jgi:ribosomal protein L37E
MSGSRREPDMQKSTRCHRCGDPLTVYPVDEEYCQPCRRDIRTRQDADARRVQRFAKAKSLDRWGPVA